MTARSRSCHSARERPSLRSRWSSKQSHIVPLPNRWRCPTPLRRRRFAFRRPWVWLAAATVLVAAGLYVVQSQWASTDAAPPRAIPLTSLPGVVRSPSLSPDGTYVVFSWNGPGKDNPDLYVQQIGVTDPPYRRLTSDPANDYSPSWSPDGRTIAFLRRRRDGGKIKRSRCGGLRRWEDPNAKWRRSSPDCPLSGQPRSRGARTPRACSSRIRPAPTDQTRCFRLRWTRVKGGS